LLDSTDTGERVIRGGILRMVSYGLMVALSVLATALLTRHLGVAAFGSYTTVLSLVAIVAFVTDAGMSAVGVREFAVRTGAERDDLMSDLLGLRVTLTAVGVVLVTGFALAAGYDPALLAGAVLASVGTVALVIRHTHTTPIAAELRIGTLSALELARQTLSVAMIVVLIALGASLLPLLAVVLAANVMLIAPTATLARHRVSLRLRLRPRQWLVLTRLTMAFSLASAVGIMYIYTAQVITSLVASEQQSGLFAASFRIFVVIGGVPNLLVSGALPAARPCRARRRRAAGLCAAPYLRGLIDPRGGRGVGDARRRALHDRGCCRTEVRGLRGSPPDPGARAGRHLRARRLELCPAVAEALQERAVVANVGAFVVSCSLTSVLASDSGASGAAVATVCGESVLAIGLLTALVRARPELRPPLGVVGKVALATAPAAVVALTPAESSLVRTVLALGLYGLLIALVRALPAEVLPARMRRAS
jgi:O-antigen/teichoic acid export membrane protein